MLVRLPELMEAPPLRVLFICRQNRRRSATAERIFAKDPSLDVRSAGTDRDALVSVNDRMLAWADTIFTMDDGQRRALERQFPGHEALGRLICLEIPDDFIFLDPELVHLLEDRARPHIDRVRAQSRTPGPEAT
jgi:predicted protein tyrosine phosphatase